MLFNSFAFVLAFLPGGLVLIHLAGRYGPPRLALSVLAALSLLFYAWWRPAYLPLLVGSILFNYIMGRLLARRPGMKALLALGVAVNLLLLAYFKYAGFFSAMASPLGAWRIESVVLPLAISFFTFQQIAFLVDVYRGGTREPDFLRYAVFVSFFPQLIAGPIVHHREMLPQLVGDKLRGLRSQDLAIGATIFILGLAKKVLLADRLASISDRTFDAAAVGSAIPFWDAWGGALAFALQIYFDFSGYSDMAIGLAAMIGIRLPLNFNSPYKSGSIVEFWQRWHMTLSRFLRDYLYIPLGGNRRGAPRRVVNLMTTMLLGGLWHGAGMTFVAWGGMHGMFLVINHWWRSSGGEGRRLPGPHTGKALTLFAVVVAWVLFRAENFEAAMSVFGGMVGANGFGTQATLLDMRMLLFVGVVGIAVLILPDIHDVMGRYSPALDIRDWARTKIPAWLGWRPSAKWAVVSGGIAVVSFAAMLVRVQQEFIYFQF